ncbi:calcineurin B homologous protein 3-like [Hoplias malabaricus]|uniref:calcineurin B homologous protein 3-like n=1 Tax=Hoplias malabaricus TaxID=27720 RepID=UPI00346252A5
MGSSQSAHDDLQRLSDGTGFSTEQIRNLHKRFNHLTHNQQKLRREDFDNISDLTFNPIRGQIIEAFFDKRNFTNSEVGKVEEVDFEEFLTVMSHFRPAGQNLTEEERERSKRDKLRFLFNMHDKDNDGTITLDEYRHVVEELLSSSPDIEVETAKAIADAAMLEVASVTMGQMAPDEFYEGITFEHFYKILKDLEIETKMHIRFLNVDTTTMSCGK